VTTPGEFARQIMHQVYTKATFHSATGPLCARASENSRGRVDKTVPAQAQSARFDVATTPDELVVATRQAIADATAFDARDINRNFDYGFEAYGEVKRSLRPEEDSSTNEVTHAYSHFRWDHAPIALPTASTSSSSSGNVPVLSLE
jgi:hypothetical protein